MLNPEIYKKLLPRLTRLLEPAAVIRHPPVPESAQALLTWAVGMTTHRPVIALTDGPRSAELLHHDLLTLAPEPMEEDPPLLYPAWESLPKTTKPTDARHRHKASNPDPEITGNRLRVLQALRPARENKSPPENACPRIFVSPIQAMLQQTLTPACLDAHTVTLRVGDEHDLHRVRSTLVENGYEFVPEAVEKGQASVKGGILDAWPPNEHWPVRIEYFGSAIESIRTYDPATQRSVAKLSGTILLPADEWSLLSIPGNAGSFPAHLSARELVLWTDTEGIEQLAETQDANDPQTAPGPFLLSFTAFKEQLSYQTGLRQWFFSNLEPQDPSTTLHFESLQRVFPLRTDVLHPDVLQQLRQRLMEELRRKAGAGHRVICFFDTPGTMEHFKEEAARSSGGAEPPGFELCTGRLSGGFAEEDLALTIVSEADLYGRRKKDERRYDPFAARNKPDRARDERLNSLTELNPGDLVVHVQHGLGRFVGIQEIKFDDQLQEVLTIEYADEAKLHVPLFHVHLLSRYVGVGTSRTELHRLGGKRWEKEKASAERSIRDLAASLLETQARRNLLTGHTFRPDTPWQREFEASFPYQETPDQQVTLRAVKADMEAARPMDRLICGDAGYGKTEVAMRAAFKAVMEAKQVAVLVPTTVLAQQHFDTFTERMSPYPIRVEALSRFCGAARHGDILRGLAEGTVDIVIGTHALLQPGVRFKDLGLVIIDEEQRFGVDHKERLKQIRQLVEVLTLTATPIPRTLYLSMTGARDMSLLQTPPRERMAVETIVTRPTDAVIREAILRELHRDGQVFYLHNRIQTIGWVQERLRTIVPEARIAVAHGQMPSAQLADVMERFSAGEFNLLLCTTIIESGLDIPRANTILIDRADRFGMADLYQLRGRVGRSSRKAYAYLLLPSQGPVDSTALKRVAAIRQHSGLSAGFQLALKDLEIRGAGNLLGAEQSGHIAAIGFGLYCQLLKRTVSALKGEAQPPLIDVELKLDFIDMSPQTAGQDHSAVLPPDYVEEETLRVGLYRRLAESSTPAELQTLEEEMRDRFGPLPGAAARLLKIAALRIAAAEKAIRKVETREGRVMLSRYGDYLMQGQRFPRLTASRTEDRLDELERLIQECEAWAEP